MTPHPYANVGAPYGNASPWFLRHSVVAALLHAQNELAIQRPGWKIMLFDAWRPTVVQVYMVEREIGLFAKAEGLVSSHLTMEDRKRLEKKVFRIWAIPSDDPAMPPPPHSTGAVIDCTLVDSKGREVNMGSPIDENSERSNPNYFATATDAEGQESHTNRLLLLSLMDAEGFQQNKTEWWHFSIGDQYWAWREREAKNDSSIIARYGRVDSPITI